MVAYQICMLLLVSTAAARSSKSGNDIEDRGISIPKTIKMYLYLVYDGSFKAHYGSDTEAKLAIKAFLEKAQDLLKSSDLAKICNVVLAIDNFAALNGDASPVINPAMQSKLDGSTNTRRNSNIFFSYNNPQNGVQQSGCRSCACDSDPKKRWAYVNTGTNDSENGRRLANAIANNLGMGANFLAKDFLLYFNSVKPFCMQ